MAFSYGRHINNHSVISSIMKMFPLILVYILF